MHISPNSRSGILTLANMLTVLRYFRSGTNMAFALSVSGVYRSTPILGVDCNFFLCYYYCFYGEVQTDSKDSRSEILLDINLTRNTMIMLADQKLASTLTAVRHFFGYVTNMAFVVFVAGVSRHVVNFWAVFSLNVLCALLHRRRKVKYAVWDTPYVYYTFTSKRQP